MTPPAALAWPTHRRHVLPMIRYELRLYMHNACGPAILGEVAALEAADQDAAVSEARGRVSGLPKRCFGVLFDPAGAEIWSAEAPSSPVR